MLQCFHRWNHVDVKFLSTFAVGSLVLVIHSAILPVFWMPVHLPKAYCSPYNLAQLLDSNTTPFGAYNLQVSLPPPKAEAAGSPSPIPTAYSSFSKSESPFIHALLPLSLQLMQLTWPLNSSNFCTRQTPWCWKSGQRLGGMSAARQQEVEATHGIQPQQPSVPACWKDRASIIAPSVSRSW